MIPMPATLFSAFSALAGLPMLVLLAKATLILVLALSVTIAMQRASAGARHLVWLVTLAALLLVPALTAWAPLPFRVLPAPDAAPTVTAAPTTPSAPAITNPSGAMADDERAAPAENTGATVSSGLTAAASFFDGMTALSILTLVWALVVLAIAASLGYAALVVRRIVRHAKPLDAQDWVGPMWEVADRLGLNEPPRLLRSEEAKMPFACGVMKPTIVLPAECDTWTLDRRHAVLLHELAHVRRHDLVGHTLGRMACAFYWFHPLVWTAAKQLRSESERACDDLALSCGARATDYAEHLLDIVTSVRRDATPSVALAMARRKEFEGRMLAILDPELRHSSPSRIQSASLIGSLALISIIVGAAAPAPRVVNEAQPTATQAVPQATQSVAEKVAPKVKEWTTPVADEMDVEPSTFSAPSVFQRTTTTVNEQTTVNQQTVTNQNTVAGSIGAAIASAAVKVGSDALMNIIKNGQGTSSQKGDDERPALLANVLRTDASAELRRIAAWGLAEYADANVAENALAEAVRRDADPGVREMAAWALAHGDDHSAAIEALAAALRGDASVRVRVTAAWALGNIDARSAIDALSGALSDASPEVRRRAAWAIGQSQPKQAPRALVNMLSDKDADVRELVAWALYQIEDPATIPALEAALRTETVKELRIDYIRALAALGEKSVDAIRGLLESRDPEIKTIAVRALAGGQATGPWPWPWPEPRPFP